MRIENYNKVVTGVVLMMALLLTGCSGEDELDGPVPMVKAQLNFSLPARITGVRHAQKTRMTSDVVQEPQEGESENDYFRGIDDVHLLCFDEKPTETSNRIGGIIEMKTSGGEVVDDVTEEDYSLCQEISIPVGTSHFGFYARAADAPKTHEERMKYGIIQAVGIDKTTYQGNSAIRFRPVPICTSTEALGGSQKGQALLKLLNDLMNITSSEAAPNNKWATVGHLYLNEAYQRMTALTTLSSYNVQVMLGFILKLIHQQAADDPGEPDEVGQPLVTAITKMITDCCSEEQEPDIENGIIELREEYQGFPADIHLPAGAARIKWNAEKSLFEPAGVQAYGKSLNVMSINDYVYPMNLQYQIFSNLLASDEQVLYGDDEGTETGDATHYNTWQELLDNGYEDAKPVVEKTTQSVAMIKQVEYAVGRLALKARLATGDIKDANADNVRMYDGVFTLKSYIIGGQREVDYNFQPVESDHRFAIYDTELNGGPQPLKRRYYTEVPDYVLGLGTKHGENICLAMELVNNGDDFQGADGVIVHGATFYLVADMNPKNSEQYAPGTLDQIFNRDHATQVNLTIESLATATNGLPSLEIPHPTVGVSVNLSWGEGLWYEQEL